MPVLRQPYVLRRVLAVGQRVVRDERRHAGPAGDVVRVVLDVPHEVVAGVRLPRQLQVQPGTHFMALGDAAGRIRLEQEPLGAGKEKQLVLFQRAAELRRDVGVFQGLGRVGECRVGLRDCRRHVVAAEAFFGAEEVEQAVEAIATGLGDRVDHRPRKAAVLGRRAEALELVLLDHVVVVERPGGPARWIARVDPVDQEGIARPRAAAIRRAAVHARGVVDDVDRGAGDRRAEQQRLRNRVLRGAALDVDHGGISRDRDVLGETAHLHLEIDGQLTVGGNLQIGAAGLGETGQIGGDLIDAHFQRRKAVASVRVRRVQFRALLAGQRHGDPWEHGPLLVLDVSRDGSRQRLTQGRRRERGRHQQRCRRPEQLVHG